MLNRLVAVLLLKHGLLVRSQWFSIHQVIGNPMSTVERFATWDIDELVLLDIGGGNHDLRRSDIAQHYGGSSALDVLDEVSNCSFMPLAFGGGIRTLKDAEERVARGADKIVIRTAAEENPAFITEVAELLGSQAVVVSIDDRRRDGRDTAAWAVEAQERGAGEVFLNSKDRDGTGLGYDTDLIRRVSSAVSIPVVACGGVGKYEHLPEGITAGADAVAAANIFHFFELAYPLAKQACIDAGIPMRKVDIGNEMLTREPTYNPTESRSKARSQASAAQVTWCSRCVYPSASAVPLEFDDEGVCTGCRGADEKAKISKAEWRRRWGLLKDIAKPRDGEYDCVIPVSGGKDSYFQTHVIVHELGLKPLLVTYDANNWTPEGYRNMRHMREAFDIDHIVYSPSVPLLVKLNRLGFYVMGDMNWHAHVGITTLPVRIAVKFGIPLIIWGEHGYLDLAGQFSLDDFPEMNYRDRLEHFARGYEWNYFVGKEGITAKDMLAFQYPSDKDIFDLNLRGIYLGNYLHWEANEHAQMVIERYGWQPSSKPFERTYRTISNLDDRFENGVHDYLKWVKFGYGRCTDHACKDIRAGKMTRDEAIELVRRYDHVRPSDLYHWLDYVGMREEEFDRVANGFRDPRVWRREKGEWVKANLWDREMVMA